MSFNGAADRDQRKVRDPDYEAQPGISRSFNGAADRDQRKVDRDERERVHGQRAFNGAADRDQRKAAFTVKAVRERLRRLQRGR